MHVPCMHIIGFAQLRPAASRTPFHVVFLLLGIVSAHMVPPHVCIGLAWKVWCAGLTLCAVLHSLCELPQVRQTQNVDNEPGSPSSGTNWTDITDARTFRHQ